MINYVDEYKVDMSIDNNELRELQKRISLILSEKEQLEDENVRLKEQIEQFRILYISSIEFATSIENDLQKKIESFTSNSKDIKSKVNVTMDELKVRLALQIDINENSQNEIRILHEELEKSRLLYFNIVEHSTFLENALDIKVDEVTKLAQTDSLTGTFNRFKFYQSIHEEMEKFKRNRNSLSVIMFDLDYFKQINDVHGHDIGDSVLVNISQITNKVVRKNDTFSRWGGEEFMILLPETDIDEASLIAERLRVSVAEFHFEEVGHVACSFGVTVYKYPEDVKEFLKRVDKALYKAKESGRNKVVTS